mmetsp:Transcript_46641/g.123787  ORF Transcript_46641/g.123787 Transcript_46641/m.123787 type:complete len:80 (+) Transcript_46641:1498-1737(+)
MHGDGGTQFLDATHTSFCIAAFSSRPFLAKDTIPVSLRGIYANAGPDAATPVWGFDVQADGISAEASRLWPRPLLISSS